MHRHRTVAAGVALAIALLPAGGSNAERAKISAPPKLGLPLKLPSGAALRLERPEWFGFKSMNAVQNTGPEVRAADYRWQVALQISVDEGWRCGGILIAKTYVLTAAHCLDALPADNFEEDPIPVGRNQLKITFGDDSFGAGTVLTMDPKFGVVFHDKWKKTGQPFAWDAALIKLEKPPVGGLPAPVRSVAVVADDAVVSGWGDYDIKNLPSATLRAVKVPIVDNGKCRGWLTVEQARNFGDFALCTVSPQHDACPRDSGGPLVIGAADAPQTVGIVSWGPPGDCGKPGASGELVGIYTRASQIAPWVRAKTGDAGSVTDRVAGKLFSVKPIGVLSKAPVRRGRFG